jgi:uncharacterized protein (TIGR02001 family)
VWPRASVILGEGTFMHCLAYRTAPAQGARGTTINARDLIMSTSARGLAVAMLFAGAAFAAPPARADETDPPSDLNLTGHVAALSDYRFRGLSRSSGDPAVQGGLYLDHISGFHASVWASTVNFDSVGPAAEDRYGGQEVDLTAGWAGPVGGGLIADFGMVYYAFPGGELGQADFFEPYAALSTTLGPMRGKVGVKYAWKQEALNFNGGRKDDNLYVHADLDAGIPATPFSIAAHLGYTDGALSPKFVTGQTPHYAGGLDWSLGATWTVTRNLSLSANYIGVEGRSLDEYSNDTVVAAIKLSF